MSITRNFNLYLNAGHSIPLVINASQYDQGEIWNFTIYNSDGTQYTPTDASIVGKKSDGNLIAIAATVSDGIVSVTETQQMTAAAGKNLFELQIDSLTHGTANFVVLVEPDPTQDGVASESALSLIDQAINGGVSSIVRQAIYTLLSKALYMETGLDDEKSVIQSWATEVTAISLNQTSISISGIGTYQLSATTTPSGATVIWTSSDTSIATVDSTGLVTSVANGTATITATSGNKSATCAVTVTAVPVLASISAVYTQGGTITENNTLDDLKTDLVVTATYDDSSTATVASTDYTLSGTLSIGTSTITVAYGGMTTTFTVTVSDTRTVLYNWDFTSSLTDSVGNVTATLGGSAAQSASGVTFSSLSDYIDLGEIYTTGITIELDVSADGTLAYSSNGRLLTMDASWGGGNNCGAVYRGTSTAWTIYNGSWVTESNALALETIQGETIKYEITASAVNFYIGDTLAATSTIWTPKRNDIMIGSSGNSINGLIVTACRVYQNE